MIKVLLIGMSDNLGGIESFLINFYRKINKTKFNVDFINIYKNDLVFSSEILDNGSKIINIPNEIYHPFKCYYKLKKIINDGKYDIVHINKNSLALSSILHAVSRSNAKVKILHSHNSNSTHESFLSNLLHSINKKIFLNKFDCFFACSDVAGKWMFGCDMYNKGNVIIIKNAVDLEKFKYNESARIEIRKKLNVKDNSILIGNIGRFTEVKNQKFLIEVFKKIIKINPNYCLILIGEGPLLKNAMDMCEEEIISGDIKFLGLRSDVDKLYQAMDVFVLPSLYEGFPMVCIEAQTSGLPMILSDTVSKKVKLLDTTLFLNLNDSKDIWATTILKNSIRNKNQNLINKIRNLGFDSNNEVKKIEEIYKKMLNK